MSGALEGIRVVDLTRALAGPYCTLMLADHGADVVKIEIPGGGDETRDWAPPSIKGVSAYYLSINRNKRSITCNLKSEEGKALLEAHVKPFDDTGRAMKGWVLVEPEGVESDDLLNGWGQRAIKFVGKLPAK